jgi:hypothetical protein
MRELRTFHFVASLSTDSGCSSIKRMDEEIIRSLGVGDGRLEDSTVIASPFCHFVPPSDLLLSRIPAKLLKEKSIR